MVGNIEHSRIYSQETFQESNSPTKSIETHQSRKANHNKENSTENMSPSKIFQKLGFKIPVKEVSNPFVNS